jgi:hypothetical protein
LYDNAGNCSRKGVVGDDGENDQEADVFNIGDEATVDNEYVEYYMPWSAVEDVLPVAVYNILLYY